MADKISNQTLLAKMDGLKELFEVKFANLEVKMMDSNTTIKQEIDTVQKRIRKIEEDEHSKTKKWVDRLLTPAITAIVTLVIFFAISGLQHTKIDNPKQVKSPVEMPSVLAHNNNGVIR